ncbi:MAG: transposase [Pseudomonadota bacterium]
MRLARRGSCTLTEHIEVLRLAVRQTRAAHPFDIDAWVVLPDHIHAVWTLPAGDCEYATRWSVIKARFSRQMPAGPRRDSHILRRERGVWQRRFWEHHLRTPQDRDSAVRYCLFNPVKHGLVDVPEAWPYSSIHRDMRLGRYAA